MGFIGGGKSNVLLVSAYIYFDGDGSSLENILLGHISVCFLIGTSGDASFCRTEWLRYLTYHISILSLGRILGQQSRNNSISRMQGFDDTEQHTNIYGP